MKTPILLICFNRPAHTRRVLERILGAEPEMLYVFQDGARDGNTNDALKCQQVRDVVAELVGCDKLSIGHSTLHTPHSTLHTYFSSVNLGCGPGPATAISWFFEQVEQGIIIEDDAVPDLEFFPYCEELLERYKNDDHVWAIGSMHLDNQTYGDGSYYFTMMNRTMCAWATWRRAWQQFNLFQHDVSDKQLLDALTYYRCGWRMKRFWIDRLHEIQRGYWRKSWDQQFWMTIWLHHGKGMMPNVNLSTNIGFDGSGVHCPVGSGFAANKPTHSILPIVHPTSTEIQHKADHRFQSHYFDPKNYGVNWWKNLPYRVNRWVKHIVRHEGPWIR